MGEVIKQEYCHGGDKASFDEVCSELRADMMSEREGETQPIAMPSQNDTATPAVETVEHSEAESIEAEGSDQRGGRYRRFDFGALPHMGRYREH